MITTPGKVRDVMGLDDNLGVDDTQLITLIGLVEKQVRRDVFMYHHMEYPKGNPSSGATWDGSNTTFQLCYPIADYDFDDSTSDDVTGIWIDADYGVNDCTVTVSNSKYGLVTITQDDGSTAIPSSAEEVYVDYYSNDEEIPFNVLEEMGTLLTCHLVTKRLTEPRKISISDLESNKKLLNIINRDFEYLYKDLVRSYTSPLLEGT
jgi:hypothetical protein